MTLAEILARFQGGPSPAPSPSPPPPPVPTPAGAPWEQPVFGVPAVQPAALPPAVTPPVASSPSDAAFAQAQALADRQQAVGNLAAPATVAFEVPLDFILEWMGMIPPKKAKK